MARVGAAQGQAGEGPRPARAQLYAWRGRRAGIVECAGVDNTSAQKMAAILTALHALSAENQSPVMVGAIARRLDMPMRTVRDTLTLMERLGLVRRVDGRGLRSRWLLGREGF